MRFARRRVERRSRRSRSPQRYYFGFFFSMRASGQWTPRGYSALGLLCPSRVAFTFPLGCQALAPNKVARRKISKRPTSCRK